MAKRKPRKRRTAAQRRATARMIAANRARRRGKRITAKKRRRSTVTRRRRRSTTTKRRVPAMARRKRRVSSRRRRRRSSGTIRFRRVRGAVYARNPGIVKQVQRGVMDTLAVLGGGAAARVASGLIPIARAGIMGAAIDLGVAVGIGMISSRFLSSDTARFVTAGAMQVPVKNLITTVVPQAGAFLGDADAGYNDVGAYLPEQFGSYAELGAGGDDEEMGEDEDLGVYAVDVV